MFIRLHPIALRLTSLAAVITLLGGAVLYSTSHPANAQATTSTFAQQPKEVQDLLTDLDDLDTLHVLLPLKLSGDQMEKLATAITTAKADYDKKSLPLTSTPLLKMADEIRETRKKALAGTPIPSTFDDRIRGIQEDVSKKRTEYENAGLSSLSTAVKAILSAEQISTAAKLEIDAYKRNKRYNDKATDGQYFNAYVLDVFLANARTPQLLREMKTAQSK